MKALAAIFAFAAVFLPDALYGVSADVASDAAPSTNNDRELHGGKPQEMYSVGEITEMAGASGGGDGNDGVESDHYYKKYETGSCTCAKDAYMKVYAVARTELNMIPLMDIYPVLESKVNELVDYAVCLLHHIDCGCEDGRFAPYKIINSYKVSTYQCCCDVNAMRDIIIESIKDLSRSWKMKYKMVGTEMLPVVDDSSVVKRNNFNVYTSIVERTAKYAKKIGGIYHGDHDPMACLAEKCPCFDIADMYSQIVGVASVASCQESTGGLAVEITGGRAPYGFCVGSGCTDSTGTRKCWAGKGTSTGNAQPLFTIARTASNKVVNADEMSLCEKAIATFCKRNGEEITAVSR